MVHAKPSEEAVKDANTGMDSPKERWACGVIGDAHFFWCRLTSYTESRYSEARLND